MSWNQVMPFLAPYIKELGAPESQLSYWVGLASGAAALASMITQPFWGKLGDSHGRKPMVLRAGFCLAGIYFGMSVCHNPLQLTILRFLNGALTGFIPGSYALIATNTPTEYAPRSVATAQAMSNAGLIAGPALGAAMAATFGYRGTMRISGIAVFIATLLVWWLVKEPNKTVPEKTSLLQDFKIALRSPIQLSLLFATFLAWMFGSAISPLLVLHLKSILFGSPEFMVGIVYALPSVAFIILAHHWTSYGERRGFPKGIIIGLTGTAVGLVLLPFANTIWIFAPMYFFIGVWLAALAPSISGITCTRVDETFRGRAYAIQQSAGTFGGFLAPIAAGSIAGAFNNSIKPVFIFVAIVYVIGIFVFRILIKRWANEKPKESIQQTHCEQI